MLQTLENSSKQAVLTMLRLSSVESLGRVGHRRDTRDQSAVEITVKQEYHDDGVVPVEQIHTGKLQDVTLNVLPIDNCLETGDY